MGQYLLERERRAFLYGGLWRALQMRKGGLRDAGMA
jgi:hypothetical protein